VCQLWKEAAVAPFASSKTGSSFLLLHLHNS